MLKRSTFFYLFTMVLFLACSKTEQKSYEYWNEMVNGKSREINTLIQSVPCSNIKEFEIVRKGSNYYLVHSSVRQSFDKLQTELEQLEKERSVAYNREDWIGGDLPPTIPSHPVRKVCDNGKPRLVYVNDLSIEEINAELSIRYEEIQNFYKNVSCTDASQWIGRYIFLDCNVVEAVAVHKTIQKEEIVAKIDIYNQMMVKKILSEKQECIGGPLNYNIVFESKPVQCKDGKPVVILE